MKRTPLRRKPKAKKKDGLKQRSWYSSAIEEIAKKFAKERDGYICQKTGEHVSGSNAHGSHVVPVSAGNSLRWDLNNIKCLSFHEHMNWWHKNPLEAAEWFAGKFPDRKEYLEARRWRTVKISTQDLSEFYERARTCATWQQYQEVYDSVFEK